MTNYDRVRTPQVARPRWAATPGPSQKENPVYTRQMPQTTLADRLPAYLMYFLWKAVTFVVISPIYLAVIAEGLRISVPALGQKLYKVAIPGFHVFGEYVVTRRLDLAVCMALVLLFAVWWLWEQVLHVLLSTDEFLAESGWDPDAYRRLVMALGFIILGGDSALFYGAIVISGWGEGAFSLTALLATAVYLCVIVFVSLVSLKLRKRIG